jgi:acyl carrier protein
VRLRLEVTRRNQPAQQFLQSVASDLGHQPDGSRYTFSARALETLTWRPAVAAAAPRATVRKPAERTRKFVEFAEIARDLSTPAQIFEAMRRESAPDGPAGTAGMTPTEEVLASIWADLLQRPAIPVTANFFDMGGHSLLAVLLIMRVREAFGVELPIDDVYSATVTLGELARKIEMYQLGTISPSEYESLLAEIENLSDEEVQRLLAEEDPGALRS